MAYLSSIIEAVKTQFPLEIQGECNQKIPIDGVRFADESDAVISHLTPNILYLADYENFRFSKMYGNVLYYGCGDSTPSDDCLYIRKSIDVFVLYNIISDRLFAYQKMRQNEDQLFNNLYAGKEILDFICIAHRVLNNPIVVLDSIFSVVSYYPSVDDPYFESKDGVLFLNSQTITRMKDSNLLYRIQHSVYPFSVFVKELGHEIIFESVRIQRAVVGYLCVRCTNHNVSEDELEYVHALSQIISLQFHQSEDYQNPYGIKYDLFLKQLFIRRFDSEEAARSHLSFLNLTPKKSFCVVACGFYEKPPKLLPNDQYCQLLFRIFPGSITGLLEDHFVTLITLDDSGYFSEPLLDRLKEFLSMNKMKAAVSYSFSQLMLGGEFYLQASNQLSHMLASYTESPIGFYADYYIHHLTELAGNYFQLKSMIHPSIIKMVIYDQKHQTSYLETLATYFDNNRNAPATAKALFIHKSTLFYRFSKMSSLFDIEFEKKDDLFAYEFSLRLFDILRAQNPNQWQ